MLHGRRLVVVMPAYNAEHTLRRTYAEIPHEYVDEVILVDDSSSDATADLARELGIRTIVHRGNRGYGGNQKTCYRAALKRGAEVVVMLHPDYQYSPRLITAMATMITSGHYDAALGSRIIGGKSLHGGMPFYKYVANRLLTLVQNLVLGSKLTEFHTGYRAFSRELLLGLPLEENSDDFVFDNEMLAQCLYFDYRIGEISCPTRYFEEASSIGFRRAVTYGVGVVHTTWRYLLAKRFGVSDPIFRREGGRLDLDITAGSDA